MGGRRLAVIAIAALGAAVASRGASAQPQGPASSAPAPPAPPAPASAAPGAPVEIEMEPAPASAPVAPPAKDARLARKWLAAAQQLMQKGNYFAARNRPDDARPQFENAVTAYQKAIEAGDDPNLYLELANAEDRLGKLVDAVRHLRHVTGAAGARPEVVRKAGARLDELLAKVGLVTLTIAPPGASITLGGAELGTAPLTEPLVLIPGTYTLSFQAAGYQPREAEIVVEPGTRTERAIDLEPVKVIFEPVAPAAVVAAARAEASRTPSKLPLYLGAGIAGAAVIDAAIFGGLAIAQHATFTGASTSRLDREDARSNGRRFAVIADVSLAVAVVASGFTAYWYFQHYRQPRTSDDRRSRPVDAKLGVVPWVQSQSGGAALAGWF
jgi:hypothetical protein